MTNEVKFSTDTISRLKLVGDINQSLKVAKDKKELRSLSTGKTIAAIAEWNISLPRDFYVYDVREFVTVLQLFKNPVVDFSNEKYVVIKSEDGNQKMRYIDAAENLITSYFGSNVELTNVSFSVELTAEQMKAVSSAASTLNLPYVGFKCDGTEVFLVAFDTNNGDNQEQNSYSIKVSEFDKPFNLFYSFEKNKSFAIFSGDCKFEVDASKLISKVTSTENVTFIAALDSNSTFDQ